MVESGDMWSRDQRQSAVRLFLKRLGILSLFLLVAFSIPGVWSVYHKERESQLLRAQAEREWTDLVERQTQLEEDLSKLQTDRGLEETLREQFALALEGERLIVIVDPPKPAEVHASSSVREWFKNVFWWW